MPLRDFLALDDDAFRTLFRGSPIKRIKRARFLRNVCVALGNIGTRDDLPALKTAATDPDALIAEHAQWAVTRIQSRAAVQTGSAAAMSRIFTCRSAKSIQYLIANPWQR